MRATWRILPLTSALARVPVADFWGLSPKRFLEAVEHRRFEELLGDAAELWLGFCAWLAENGHDRAILRLYAGEEAGGPYFLWVVYRVEREDDGFTLTLEGIALPHDEPESYLATPEDLEGEPYFAYPPGEPRMPWTP